jgi:hypothetical protein
MGSPKRSKTAGSAGSFGDRQTGFTAGTRDGWWGCGVAGGEMKGAGVLCVNPWQREW